MSTRITYLSPSLFIIAVTAETPSSGTRPHLI